MVAVLVAASAIRPTRESQSVTDQPADSFDPPMPAPPRAAQEALLGLGGIAFLALVLCLIAYRVFGAQLTAGLDEACAEAAFQAGQQFEAQGNLSQAVLKYRQAMDGRFEDDTLRFMCGRAIGDLLFKQDQFGEAVAAYASLPPAAFDRAGAYTGYVTALWRTGELDGAAKLGRIWLEKAAAENEANQEIWARNVLMHVARTQGDPGTALAHGTRILELAPGNDAAITVARILMEQGQPAEARARVEAMLAATESPALRQAGRDVLEQLAAGAPPP